MHWQGSMLTNICVPILCTLVLALTSAHSSQEGLECFRKTPEECAPLDDPSGSRCRKFGSDIYCCHIDSEAQLIQGLRASGIYSSSSCSNYKDSYLPFTFRNTNYCGLFFCFYCLTSL